MNNGITSFGRAVQLEAARAWSVWDLAKPWPGSDLGIVPHSGHAMTEPGIIDEFITATERFAANEMG